MVNAKSFLKFAAFIVPTLLALAGCDQAQDFSRLGSVVMPPAAPQDEAANCPTGAFNQGTGFDNTVNQIWVDPGSCLIYVSGDFTHYRGTAVGHLVRLFPDGSMDNTFAVGSGPNAHLSAIVPMNDGSGRIYLGGNFTSFNDEPIAYLVRIYQSGIIDYQFNLGTGIDGIVFRIVVPNDGSNQLYVTGNFTHVNGVAMGRLVRLNSDASVDTSFAIGQGFDALVQNMVLAPEDNSLVYAGGDFLNYQGKPANHLIRLKADGSVDQTFNVGAGFGIIAASIYGLIATDDGSNRIYVTQGGDLNYPSAPTYQSVKIPPGITRINSDGSIDNTFNIGTGFITPKSAGGVFNVNLMNDGSHRLYASGYFTQVNGVAVNNFARINPDGSLDTTFNIGTGFSTGTYFAPPAAGTAGDIYVFGPFQSYQGQTVGGMVRMTSSGKLD
jgi:hypothetical protein